jgi:hypothetical protein
VAGERGVGLKERDHVEDWLQGARLWPSLWPYFDLRRMQTNLGSFSASQRQIGRIGVLSRKPVVFKRTRAVSEEETGARH